MRLSIPIHHLILMMTIRHGVMSAKRSGSETASGLITQWLSQTLKLFAINVILKLKTGTREIEQLHCIFIG